MQTICMNPNLTPYQHGDEETYFYYSLSILYNQGTEYKTHAAKQRRPVKQMIKINNTNGYVFLVYVMMLIDISEQDCRLGLFS